MLGGRNGVLDHNRSTALAEMLLLQTQVSLLYRLPMRSFKLRINGNGRSQYCLALSRPVILIKKLNGIVRQIIKGVMASFPCSFPTNNKLTIGHRLAEPITWCHMTQWVADVNGARDESTYADIFRR